MQFRLPPNLLPFKFQTRLGEVQVIIARGGFTAPGFALETAAAFAFPTDPNSGQRPVQISALKATYGEIMEMMLTGFELPFDIAGDDEFLAAVIDGLLADARV